MKKFIAIVVSLICISFAASAQPRALGLRGGFGGQVSYEHSVGNKCFLEGELGLYGLNSLHVEGLFNFIFAGGETFLGNWNAYWGLGAVAGLYTGNEAGTSIAAAAAQIGIEFNFSFPIQISADIRPQLGTYLSGDGKSGTYNGCFPAIGIRYMF